MNGTLRFACAAIASVAAGLGMPTGAAAQDASLPDWKFGAIVYGWFPAAGGRSHDAPENVEGAEISPWGANAELSALGFDDTASATRRQALRRPLGEMAAPFDTLAPPDLRARNWTWSLLGSYALVARPNHRIELLGGARYLHLNTSADGRLAGNVSALPVFAVGPSARESEAWDAVVGTRGRYRFGTEHRWFLPYYVDVGAGQSDLTWQAMGGIGYAFSWGEVSASYRHLDYRFGTGSQIRDLSFSGPGVAFGFRW